MLGGTLGMSLDPINWGLAFLIFYLAKMRWRFHFVFAVVGIFLTLFLVRYGIALAEPAPGGYSPFAHVVRISHAILGFSLFAAAIFYFISKWKKKGDTRDNPVG